MQQSLEKLLAFRDDVAPESLICPHIPALGLGNDHAAIAIAAEWFGYATRPEILDCVEALLGPDIVLWGSQVFCKPAHTGRKIPWHQDGKYWPMRPLATALRWLDGLAPTSTIWAWPWASKWVSAVMLGLLKRTRGAPICENGKLYLSLTPTGVCAD